MKSLYLLRKKTLPFRKRLWKNLMGVGFASSAVGVTDVDNNKKNIVMKTRKLTPNEELLKLAMTFLGLQEIEGEEDNPTIVQWFADIGFAWIKDDETAWCSLTINWLAWKLGLERSGKLNAKSWLDVGMKVTDPIPGDVVILYRGKPNDWTGHVGIFIGYNKAGDIFMWGGNQKNEINITPKGAYRLLGFRRLRKVA